MKIVMHMGFERFVKPLTCICMVPGDFPQVINIGLLDIYKNLWYRWGVWGMSGISLKIAGEQVWVHIRAQVACI